MLNISVWNLDFLVSFCDDGECARSSGRVYVCVFTIDGGSIKPIECFLLCRSEHWTGFAVHFVVYTLSISFDRMKTEKNFSFFSTSFSVTGESNDRYRQHWLCNGTWWSYDWSGQFKCQYYWRQPQINQLISSVISSFSLCKWN